MLMRVSAGSALSRVYAHAPMPGGDVERLLVARHLVAVEQARENLVQGVVRRPDLRVLRPVGGALFEHDELIGRVSADEADAPVPVVVADGALPQVGVVAEPPGTGGTAIGSATAGPPAVAGRPDFRDRSYSVSIR